MPSAMARKADVPKVRNYERRRPERTLLYQLIEEHYPRFRKLLASQDRSLPEYVQREFDDFLKCGILEHGFLRVRCQDCHNERLVAFSCCPQRETMMSPESRVRYSPDPPRDSLPIVSDR